jgi:hypothetical protein
MGYIIYEKSYAALVLPLILISTLTHVLCSILFFWEARKMEESLKQLLDQ